jgi:transcriptional regulator with XRE-family HTH domain
VKFGPYVRILREKREISLRKFAEKLEKSPTLVSHIEIGHDIPLSEETITKWAQLLDEDPDLFLAMNGKISEELTSIIIKNPLVFSSLIRNLKSLSKKRQEEVVEEVVRKVQDGEW